MPEKEPGATGEGGIKSLAQEAYEAWDREAREHVGSCPPWETLPNGIKNAWNAALERAFEVYKTRYPTVAFPVQPSDDDELTCLFCTLGKCTLQIEVYGGGRRVWCGAHEKCIEHHEARVFDAFREKTS